MPSYTDKTTGTTASTIENVVYAKERMGQEANNAYTNTSTTANGYANEAKGAGSVATDTAREYVASTGVRIQTLFLPAVSPSLTIASYHQFCQPSICCHKQFCKQGVRNYEYCR